MKRRSQQGCEANKEWYRLSRSERVQVVQLARRQAARFPGLRLGGLILTAAPGRCAAHIARETAARAWLIRLFPFAYRQLDKESPPTATVDKAYWRRYKAELPDDPLSEDGRLRMEMINAKAMVYSVAALMTAGTLALHAVGNPMFTLAGAAIAEVTMAACLGNMIYYDRRERVGAMA